jgi:NTP pyrophosphatase (non-canonical NTP hydrolase)
MDVKGFQKLMKDLYFERDKKRGKEKTLLWLIEEAGELSEAMRRGDAEALEEEIADIIAWTASLANLLDIDLEEALEKKYPGRCRYCGSIPCTCEKSTTPL